MARLTKRDMEELREFCSLGCDYAGTREEVTETQNEAIKVVGYNLSADEMFVSDGETNLSLDVLLDKFYELMSDKLLNVVETQGR